MSSLDKNERRRSNGPQNGKKNDYSNQSDQVKINSVSQRRSNEDKSNDVALELEDELARNSTFTLSNSDFNKPDGTANKSGTKDAPLAPIYSSTQTQNAPAQKTGAKVSQQKSNG